MIQKPFFIRAEWDEEARVWVATSDDVPGLVTEASDMDSLIEKLKIIIPELLEANKTVTTPDIPFELILRRFEVTQRLDI